MKLLESILLAGFVLAARPAAAEPGMSDRAEKKVLTLAGAKSVAAAVEVEARKKNVGGAVAVVDDGGNLIYLVRIDDTFPAAATVAFEKARTAAQFRRPTSVFEDAVTKSGRTALLGVSVITPLQGGIPILADGQVIGAVGVSGASSADQDTEFAKLAAAVVH